MTVNGSTLTTLDGEVHVLRFEWVLLVKAWSRGVCRRSFERAL